MKTTIQKLRSLFREQFAAKLEDLDRERRIAAGYDESDGEADYKDLPEDVDRVRRHADKAGDDLEECGMNMNAHEQDTDIEPSLETNLAAIVIPVEDDATQEPELESMSLKDAADMNPEKAKQTLKHGHLHGKTLSRDEKSLYSMIAAAARRKQPAKKKSDK